MCADGAKEPAQRFAYKNAVQGLLRIWSEEGAATLGRGLGPTLVRSVLMSKHSKRSWKFQLNVVFHRCIANCNVSPRTPPFGLVY